MEQLLLGFTGTREGMTPEQKKTVKMFVENLKQSFTVLGLHGDCVGADVDFHGICRELGLSVFQRPGNIPVYRARTDAAELDLPTDPMIRNAKIVDQAGVLLACPVGEEEEARSGTWATIRMGRKAKKQVIIIYPDGSLIEDCYGSAPREFDA